MNFKRRKPEESQIAKLDSLEQLHDFIRMLDAEGYPRAFLSHGGYRFEFSRSALYDGRIVADVHITHEPKGSEPEKPNAKAAESQGAEEMSVLVVAAHPDDEILGCGGTIARLAREGHEVRIAILAEGMSSRYAHREDADPGQLQHLHARAQQAGNKVGAREVVLCKLPDNRLDTVPLLEVVKLVEDLVARFRPEVIYTHHPGDLNVDHGVVHRAVLTATRPVAGQCVSEIYAFEVPSSTEWAFQRLEPSFRPNVFVDITKTLETKIDALACYDTEMRKFPHPRSAEALRAIATRWGSVVGLPAVEAFELIRSVRPAGHHR